MDKRASNASNRNVFHAPLLVSTSNAVAGAKRPAEPSAAAQAKIQRKRLKGKETRKASTLAALATATSAWIIKAERMDAWREKLLSGNDSLTGKELLLATLNEVRKVDSRDPLNARQRDLVPSDPALLDLLQDIFLEPLTWNADKHAVALAERTSSEAGQDMQVDGLAQFYIRRICLEDHNDLSDLMEKTLKLSAYYTAHAAVLLKASELLEDGPRWLSYGGYTVSSTPVGRQAEDLAASKGRRHQDQAGSFIKALLETHGEDGVLIYEVEALRFKVDSPSVEEAALFARLDPRIDVYESLVIDPFAFLSVNTAQPGMTMKAAWSPELSRLKQAVRDWNPPPPEEKTPA